MNNPKKTFIFTALLTSFCLFTINHIQTMNTRIKDLNYYKKTYPYKTFNIRSVNNKILFCMPEGYLSSDCGLAIRGVYKKKSKKTNHTIRDILNAPSHYLPLYNPKDIYNFYNPNEMVLVWFEILIFGSDNKTYSGTMSHGSICKNKIKYLPSISDIKLYENLDGICSRNYNAHKIQVIGTAKMKLGICNLVWHNGKFWMEPLPMFSNFIN